MHKFEDVEEVKEVIGYQEANKHLQKDWILISTHVAGQAGPGIPNPSLLYVLGRRRKKDQPEE